MAPNVYGKGQRRDVISHILEKLPKMPQWRKEWVIQPHKKEVSLSNNIELKEVVILSNHTFCLLPRDRRT
jgi:hypothetical protein